MVASPARERFSSSRLTRVDAIEDDDFFGLVKQLMDCGSGTRNPDRETWIAEESGPEFRAQNPDVETRIGRIEAFCSGDLLSEHQGRSARHRQSHRGLSEFR